MIFISTQSWQKWPFPVRRMNFEALLDLVLHIKTIINLHVILEVLQMFFSKLHGAHVVIKRIVRVTSYGLYRILHMIVLLSFSYLTLRSVQFEMF